MNKKITIQNMCFIALMTALMCVLAPFSIPIGPIPLSLASLVVYFITYVLGPWKGAASVLLYILIGMTGVPVFSGYSGGLAKLVGPTGGYIAGFVFVALAGGIIIKKCKYNIWLSMIGLVIGTVLLYLLGTAWFIYLTHMSISNALKLCVLPFLIGDSIKIIAATLLGKIVRTTLIKANLM